jgi:hypothetical protein
VCHPKGIARDKGVPLQDYLVGRPLNIGEGSARTRYVLLTGLQTHDVREESAVVDEVAIIDLIQRIEIAFQPSFISDALEFGFEPF